MRASVLRRGTFVGHALAVHAFALAAHADESPKWDDDVGFVAVADLADTAKKKEDATGTPTPLAVGVRELSLAMLGGAVKRRSSAKGVTGDFGIGGRCEIGSVLGGFAPWVGGTGTLGPSGIGGSDFVELAISGGLMWSPSGVRWFGIGPSIGYRWIGRIQKTVETGEKQTTAIHAIEPGLLLRLRTQSGLDKPPTFEWNLYLVDRAGSDSANTAIAGTSLWAGGTLAFIAYGETALAESSTTDAMTAPVGFRVGAGLAARMNGGL